MDVAEWAEDNEAWLRGYLILEHGTPSHDTFGQVFRLLDAQVFEAASVRGLEFRGRRDRY